MLEIKPDYYDTFSCIGGSCSFTCCQEWKIAVDQDTYEAWTEVQRKQTKIKDGGRVIKLNKQHKCPFLTEHKLCSLVLEHGPEALSHTCDTFPRQMHEFDDRIEYSLVSCCPEVIDIWWKKEAFSYLYSEPVENINPLWEIRMLAGELLSDRTHSNAVNLQMLFFVFLDIYKKEEAGEVDLSPYREKGFLRELAETIEGLSQNREDSSYEQNELFLDMIDNYRKEEMYSAYIEPIAELAEQLSEEEEVFPDDEAELLQPFEELFRKFLCAEVFTNMLIPESDFLSMIVMLQWMAMEYAVIRQGIYLKGKLLEDALTYETVRDYMVIISRMTGYDQEDIFEYLENSFETLVWDWGYFLLITAE